MFDARPNDPTTTTNFGLDISMRTQGRMNAVYAYEAGHTWGAEEAFHSFQEDGEAQCKQEDAIDQCSQDFSAMPAIGVPRVDVRLVGELDE